MATQPHHHPHGHHHGPAGSAEDERERQRAESQAQPHVDDRAPEPEEARDAIRALEERVAQLERELAAARDQGLRALADFQNFQRRMNEQEPRLRAAGMHAVVRQVIPVLDNFDMALAHDPASMTAAAALEGFRIVRGELVKALERSGVELIQPAVGAAFDPHQEQAIMQQPAPGVASGQVSALLQPGYRLGETVLRPAQVAVAP
ncbi:MAG: nucleotide exchange factor GrpE [Phycisphaerales bacterium]